MNIDILDYGSDRRFGEHVAAGLFEQLRVVIREQQLKAQIRKERQELERLPDHLLEDIGISREQALEESRRGFDDIPASRKPLR